MDAAMKYSMVAAPEQTGLISRRSYGEFSGSDADDSHAGSDDSEVDKFTSDVERDIWKLLVSKGLLGSRTYFVLRHLLVSVHPPVGILLMLMFFGFLAHEALHPEMQVVEIYGASVAHHSFAIAALLVVSMPLSWWGVTRALRTRALRQALEHCDNSVGKHLSENFSTAFWPTAEAWDSLHGARVLLWRMGLRALLGILFLRLWETVTPCALTCLILFILQAVTSSPWAYTTGLLIGLSKNMVRGMIKEIKDYPNFPDLEVHNRHLFWRRMIRDHRRTGALLAQLWEHSKMLYVPYMFTNFMAVVIAALASIQCISEGEFVPAFALGAVSWLVASALFSAMSEVAEITEMCMSQSVEDESIVSAATAVCGREDLSDAEAAEHNRFLTYLMASPMGIRILFTIDMSFVLGLGVPTVTALATLLSHLFSSWHESNGGTNSTWSWQNNSADWADIIGDIVDGD